MRGRGHRRAEKIALIGKIIHETATAARAALPPSLVGVGPMLFATQYNVLPSSRDAVIITELKFAPSSSSPTDRQSFCNYAK